jgi:hypothetical protein
MYLVIDIDTHLHMVYLDCRCRWCLRAVDGEPQNDNGGTQEIHSDAMMHGVWRCTWRTGSSEFWDALGGLTRGSFKIHLEAVIKRVLTCTWRP